MVHLSHREELVKFFRNYVIMPLVMIRKKMSSLISLPF